MAAQNIMDVFNYMSFGNKEKEVSTATEWLEQKIFCCWIDGQYYKPSISFDYSETRIGNVQCLVADGLYGVEAACISSAKAQVIWKEWNQAKRVVILNKISENLQSEKELFSNLFELQGQKDEFFLFLDYFKFYSNILSLELEDWKAIGVVLVVLTAETPAWFLAATSAAALWAGCSILIRPSNRAPVFPFLLAEICSAAGLPNGLINVVPTSKDGVEDLISKFKFDKIVYSDRYTEGCGCIGSESLISNFSMFNFGHTAFIVFDSCDLDGAVYKLFSETWKCSQRRLWRADLVLVHEPIYLDFTQRLTSKMKIIDKSNKSAFSQRNKKFDLNGILVQAEAVGVQIYAAVDNSDSDQILIIEYDMEVRDPDAPITTLLVFKTADEAVDIVNNACYCLGTSIWTENFSQAMNVASKLETCTVWINWHGGIDASVPAEVSHKSGTGVLGGLEGGLAYMIHETECRQIAGGVDKPIFHKDDYDKVLKSQKAFRKWKLINNRKAFLMPISEDMKRLQSPDNAKTPLNTIVNFWALNANSYEVTMSTTNHNLCAVQRKKPIGVILMMLNESENVFETFVSWVTPAIAMGNVVIVTLADDLSTLLTPIFELFYKHLPADILTIVGNEYQTQLAKDPNVDAVWTGGQRESILMDMSSGEEPKRFWLPPSPMPLCKMLLVKHCLKSQAVVLHPTITDRT